MVMYFDEARDLTETECALVNTTSCNIETVIREREVRVTECGVELEEKCGAVVDTRVEEECKVTTQRMCLPRARDVMSITEESECKLATGAECVQAAAGEPATICETVEVEACPRQPQLDCLPGSSDPRCQNIDEYGAPLAPVLAQDTNDLTTLPSAPCVPATKQVCRTVDNMVCGAQPGLSCDNKAREIITEVAEETCMDMPVRVCRNVTHYGTRQECNNVEVER